MGINDLISSIILEDEFSATFSKYERGLTGLSSGSASGGLALGALGAAAGGVVLSINALVSAAQFGATALFNITASAVNLNATLQDSQKVFTALLGDDPEAANRFLTDLQQTANELKVSFSDASQFAKSILPDASSFEEFNELLRLAAVGAKDANLPLEELIFSFNEAVAGDFVSIRDRLDIPKDVINRIKEADDTTAALTEELNILFTKRGINDAAALAGTFNTLVSELEVFRDTASLAFGQPITEELTKELDELVGFLVDNKEAIIELATEAGTSLAIVVKALFEAGKAAGESIELINNFIGAITGIDAGPLERVGKALRSTALITSLLVSGVVAFGTAFQNFVIGEIDNGTKRIGIFFNAASAGFEALKNFESPFPAFERELSKIEKRDFNPIPTFAEDFKAKLAEGLAGTKELLDQAKEEIKSSGPLSDALLGGGESFDEFENELQEFLDRAAEAKEKQIALVQKGNKRLADAEFAHGQRVAKIQENIAKVILDSAEEAAQARLESGAELAEGLAEIEAASGRKQAELVANFNKQIEALDNSRAKSRRNRNRRLKKIDQDLGDKLTDLATSTAVKREAVQRKLAAALKKLSEKTESDRVDIQEKFAVQRTKVEQDAASRQKAIEDELAGILTDTNLDAFARKQKKKNLEDELALLEESKNNELALLTEQEQLELTKLTAKTTEEQRILQEAADEKIRLAQEETDRRVEILERDAEKAREIADQKFADEQEDFRRKRELLEQNLAEAQAKQAEADALAIQKLNDKHAEELVKIEEQEASKVSKAQEALERENRNFADRIAAITRQNAQEQAALADKLKAIEDAEKDSQDRRLDRTRAFSAEMQRLNQQAQFFAGGGSFPTQGGGGSVTNNDQQVVINQFLASGNFPTPSATGQSVMNNLNNSAGT